jgi:hypothetical protein
VTRACLWTLTQAGRPRLQGATLFVLSLTVAFWWMNRTEQEAASNNQTSWDFLALPEIALQRVPSVATTDRGRALPLYTPVAADLEGTDLSLQESYLVRERSQGLHLLRTGPVDYHCNCHGWTFGNGHSWIKGEEVKQILDDNGYRQVSVPRVQDLIVYLDAEHEVRHSGVVCAVHDGLVLVESKWGCVGRYIHAAGDQPYGLDYVYYHSPRAGHHLHGLDDESSPAPVTDIVARQYGESKAKPGLRASAPFGAWWDKSLALAISAW